MTDREKDIEKAESLVGKPNDYFIQIWRQFASGWDGAPCSEIACCISYLAGNLELIQVSNYAAGLVSKFKAAGAFGNKPQAGAFIFFDYKDGAGPSHTGRVVGIDGNYVRTVEGNVGGIVVRRIYPKNSPYIYGYGYPAYKDGYEAQYGDKMTFTEAWYLNDSVDYITLKRGSQGKLVRDLQMYLNYWGHYNGDFDGDYGPQTEAAVRKWEETDGRPITGVVKGDTFYQIFKG